MVDNFYLFIKKIKIKTYTNNMTLLFILRYSIDFLDKFKERIKSNKIKEFIQI